MAGTRMDSTRRRYGVTDEALHSDGSEGEALRINLLGLSLNEVERELDALAAEVARGVDAVGIEPVALADVDAELDALAAIVVDGVVAPEPRFHHRVAVARPVVAAPSAPEPEPAPAPLVLDDVPLTLEPEPTLEAPAAAAMFRTEELPAASAPSPAAVSVRPAVVEAREITPELFSTPSASENDLPPLDDLDRELGLSATATVPFGAVAPLGASLLVASAMTSAPITTPAPKATGTSPMGDAAAEPAPVSTPAPAPSRMVAEHVASLRPLDAPTFRPTASPAERDLLEDDLGELVLDLSPVGFESPSVPPPQPASIAPSARPAQLFSSAPPRASAPPAERKSVPSRPLSVPSAPRDELEFDLGDLLAGDAEESLAPPPLLPIGPADESALPSLEEPPRANVKPRDSVIELDANEIESVRPSMIPGFEPGSVTKVVPPPPPLRKGGVKSVGQK